MWVTYTRDWNIQVGINILNRVAVWARQVGASPNAWKQRLAFTETFTTPSVVCIPTFPRPRETNRSRPDCHPSSASSQQACCLEQTARRCERIRLSMIDMVDRAFEEACKNDRGRKVFSGNYLKSFSSFSSVYSFPTRFVCVRSK